MTTTIDHLHEHEPSGRQLPPPDVDLNVLPFVVRPTNRLFVGFDDTTGERRWTNNLRDSLAIVGPPGYAKTAGVVIPNVLSWDGPAVVSSTRGDVFQATAAQRQRLTRPGGRVYVYDPFGSEPGVTSMGWAPHAGCRDAGIAYRRAAALTTLAAKGLSGETHWRTGASRILRGLFHAAALAGHDLSRIRSWLSRQELDEPVQILRDTLGAAEGWADDLDGINAVADRERSSFYSAAMVAIDATVEPTVLRNSVRGDTFDVDHFLRTKSTLYVIGPKHLIESIAPLLIAIIESTTDAARELAAHSGGVLADPLLVVLDEIANTPVRSLPALVSEGGGAGITTIWATQSLAFLRDRYGSDAAAGILAASPAKLIQGGASIEQDLNNVSSWAGDWREPSTTAYSGGARSGWRLTGHGGELTARRDTSREHSIGTQYRPILPPSAIQQLPPFHGWLFYRSDPPVLVRTPPAELIDGFAAVMTQPETANP